MVLSNLVASVAEATENGVASQVIFSINAEA